MSSEYFEIVSNVANLIKSDLIESGNLSSATFTFLELISDAPNLISDVESKLKIPITNNLESLIQNYCQYYYTRRCLLYRNPEYCLCGAIEHNHIDIVQALIEKGVKLDNGFSYAIKEGKLEIVKLLLNSGAKDPTDSLYYAVHYGYTSVVEFLLSRFKGIDENEIGSYVPNFVQKWVSTPSKEKTKILYLNELLYIATLSGHIEVARLLIYHGANNFQTCLSIGYNITHELHPELQELLESSLKMKNSQYQCGSSHSS